ncbi:ABC transporter family substrate-binding protein [Streptomyces sp. RB6PN25]|uniref:ABC transporter family substrate-binding protein n=1 Tax=Streptomyces humicola TaxID=2953240 RepID=A0ABT1PR59_9ACTN|nr:ABC transporter family substrate-binding protein [Streptomyces humicola]MCQ4080161.1 ABC transporter family substrate-binding protein [Streptomyces humicola]
MPHPVKAAAALVGAFALLPALGGCGSSGDDAPAAIDIAAAPRALVRDGGTLRWAVDDVPATFNTFQADADTQTAQIAAATLPSLFTIDGRGRPQRDPDYLLSAHVVQRSPQQIVDYKLNPKAEWSDGRPVTAADFIAQWKALNGGESTYWAAHNDGYNRIAKVEQGADEHEVRVTFATPLSTWQSLFTPLYPQSVTESPDAFNDGARGKLPATAGPFTVERVTGSTVTLVRNPRWWGERAKLDRIELTVVPRDQRADALADGSIDVAGIDPSALPGVARDRGVVVRRAPGAAYTQLTMNGSTGPLADERVRRAVARAIDRQAIATAVLRPAGLPVRTLGNHLVMASQYGYQDNSSAIGSMSLQSAQMLLADAGWQAGRSGQNEIPGQDRTQEQGAKAGGPGPGSAAPAVHTSAQPSAQLSASAPGGQAEAEMSGPVIEPAAVRTDKAGHPLTLRFVLPGDDPTLVSVGERIAHMLTAVGIRTEITRVSGDSFFRDHIANGDFDLALYSWPGSAYPATDARPVYAKPVPAPDGSLNVEENYARVGSDRVDQLLDQASTTLDPSTARGLAERADTRIWATAASIPLYQRPELVAERWTIVNAGAFGFATPRYQDIGFRRP